MDAERLAQYEALTQGAGFAPLSRAQVALAGADRAPLLHKFLTQDVVGKQPGEGSEGFLCNVQGRIVGYVYFFVEDDRIVLDTSAGEATPLMNHLDRYIIREDVTLHDLSTERQEWLVAGKEAGGLLMRLTGTAPPQAMYSHLTASIAEHEVQLRRVPFGGADSYFVTAPAVAAEAIAAALAEAGAVACDAEVVEALRIESATPLYGIDITVDNLPQEVDRDAQAIHFRKGCYLGQETVARIDALGHVNKKLRLVKFAQQQEIPAQLELSVGEKVVGRVTSSAWSPRHQAPLALAYIRREHLAAGTQFSSAAGPAECVAWPHVTG